MKQKMLKKLLLGTLVGVSMVSLAACSGGTDNTQESKKADTSDDKPIVVWTQGDAIKQDAEAWAKENNVEVSVVVIPFADLQTKLKQSIQDPKTAPDVFAVTKDYVKDWVDRDVALDLTDEFPDDVKDYSDQTYKDLVSLGSDKDAHLRSVTAEYPVGMMYYNRDIAKKILGTDDPEKVAEAVDSVDKWQDIYDKLNDAYDGKVKMFGTTLGVNRMIYQQREKPYVVDDTFTVTQQIADIFEVDKGIYDNKMFLAENTETDAYFAGFNNDGFFLDFLPSWGFSSKVRPQIEGKDGAGKWGITAPTFVYNRGGSFFFISKVSTQPEKAWELVKGISVDPDKLVDVQKVKVGFSSSKEANQKLVDTNYEEPLLGNQNVYEAYAKQAEIQEQDTKDVVTKYDGEIESFINDALINYGNGSLSKEEAIKGIGDQVTSAYPELTVKYDYK